MINSSRFLLILLVFMLIEWPVSVHSQDTSTSQLNIQLARTNDSLEKVYLLNTMAERLKTSDIEKAIYYSKKALKLANQIKSPEACGITNELMGELFGLKNNIQPSINYYLISAKIFEGQNNPEKLSTVYGKLGMLYYRNNYDIQQTLEYFKESLEFAIQSNNKELIAEAYNRIGNIFFQQENTEESQQYYVKAYDLFNAIGHREGLAKTLNNLGEIYRIQNETEKALDYYQKSLEINEQLNNMDWMAINYLNMGRIYSMQGNLQMSFDYYEKSLGIYNQINNSEERIKLQILMGKEYLTAGMFQKSKEVLTEAYKKAFLEQNWGQIRDAAQSLSTLFEANNETEKALFYYKTYARFSDSILLKQKSDIAIELQSRFLNSIKDKEIQLKDAEILLLNNDKEIDNLKFNMMIMIVIMVLIITGIVVMRGRSKIRKERLFREKDALLHQKTEELMKLELKNKDNDLMNFALHLVQKNQVLVQIKSELKSLSTNSDHDTSRKIKDMSIHIQQHLQIQQEIDEFQAKVDQTYDDFFKKLKANFPSLTKNEERLCALLRLNLSTKEIATLNNTSVKAVEMSRYRLRKKCQLENNECLPEYLQNI